MTNLVLTEEQKKDRLQKKIEEYRKGLLELDKKTGMTLLPLIVVDGNLRTQQMTSDQHHLQAIAQIVEINDSKGT